MVLRRGVLGVEDILGEPLPVSVLVDRLLLLVLSDDPRVVAWDFRVNLGLRHFLVCLAFSIV